MTSPAEIAELVKALRSVRASATVPPKDDTLFFVCQRAAAALEEVGKDAQRLNWLETRTTGRRWEYSPMSAGIASTVVGGFATVREAIDAAISAEGK